MKGVYVLEKWKYITNLSVNNVDENRYIINNFGQVYDNINNRYLKHSIDNEGYHRVHIHTSNGFKSKYIHRLVKIEFDGFDQDIDKDQIDHIDCNKDNNSPENLEWVTKEENARRGIKNNLYYQLDIKLTEEHVEFICQQLKQGKSYKYISDLLFPIYGQNLSGIIGKIYRGERWKNISKKYMPFPKIEKSIVIPSSSKLTEEIIRDICINLQNNYSISETAKFIQYKYDINKNLKYTVESIKRGKSYKQISKDYDLKGGKNMSKDDHINFEENIRNYGSKIEHIDSFIEAVRKLPGKIYCLA